MHACPHACGKSREVAAHGLNPVHHKPRVIEQGLAGGRKLDAAAATLEQDDAERLLEPPDAGAGGGEREIGAVGAARNAATIRDGDEELQIDQVEAQWGLSRILQPSL